MENLTWYQVLQLFDDAINRYSETLREMALAELAQRVAGIIYERTKDK